jgi:Mrp family chromosome partitioning ATPase/uncharacterized protein involved in exopolysaccharide biosynthesis
MASTLLKRYPLALSRYKWICLASFLSMVGIATAVARQPVPPTQYRAEGMLAQTTPVVEPNPADAAPKRGQEIISEQFLLSDGVLDLVSAALEEKGISIDAKTIRQNTGITSDTKADQVQRIAVEFHWNDPIQAQAILTQMFNTMVENSRVLNQAQLQEVIKALEQDLPGVTKALQQAEQDLEDFTRGEGSAIQAAEDGGLLAAIAEGQQQQRQNEVLLAGLQSQIQSLEQQLGMTTGEALTFTALSADPIIAQLRSQILEAETQLEVLSANLREAHPGIQALQTNLVAYNTLLEQRAGEVIGGGGLAPLASVSQVRQKSTLDPTRVDLANQLVALDNERRAIESQQEVLRQAVARLEAQYRGLSSVQLEQARLAQQVDLNRALYDQIQAKRIDAQAAEAETVSSLTIAEEPTTEQLTQWRPSPVTVMAMGGLLGLALAGAIALLLDMLDGVVRTHEGLEMILKDQNVKVLGIIPTLKLPEAEESEEAEAIVPVQSPYLQNYEYLRSKLKLLGNSPEMNSELEVIVVTSTRDGEGKTTSAFNLGIAAALANNRTLILEVDLHRNSRSRWLGIQPPTGVEDPLQYYAEQQSQSVPGQPVPGIDNLYLLPSPGPQANAAATLESEAMKQILEHARVNFDLVILDAPALSCNDALLFGSYTDGLVIVTRPNYTEKAVLKKILNRTDLKLLGAVINDAQTL